MKFKTLFYCILTKNIHAFQRVKKYPYEKYYFFHDCYF